MRKLMLLLVPVAIVGCQNFTGPLKKDRDRQYPDPLTSTDIDEQQRYGRSRYSYPEDDRGIAPSGFSGRPTPSGR